MMPVMYEAAVAHYEATGEKSWFNIATRNADLIYDLAVNHNFGFLFRTPGDLREAQ